MKKMFAVLCAALLVIGVAACNSNTPPAETGGVDLTHMVTFTPPSGYEVQTQSPESVSFARIAEDGEPTHEIGVAYVIADEGQKKGIASKDMTELEDGLSAEFGENVKVSFIEINGYPGIQLDTFEDDALAEICYYIILGDWMVMVVNGGDAAYLDEMHTDMKALLDTLALEELVFE